MRRILLYSMLLICGFIAAQFLGPWAADSIRILTMIALAFIMIHVGFEFEIEKNQPRQYVWDYLVAATAAALPWAFSTLYFVYVMGPPELWFHGDLWRESLLVGRFASPTSAGVLFSMLAAAGLAATWVFRKARILAIFDDLDTILLMVPLTFLMVGFRWQLIGVVALMLALLWMAWRYLHVVRLPVGWPFVLIYSIAITAVSEVVYLGSKLVDREVPVHLEVLLPAFVLGCIVAPPLDRHPASARAGTNFERFLHRPQEQRTASFVTATFMVLVGLSMPPIYVDADAAVQSQLPYHGVAPEVVTEKQAFPGWTMIALHVVAITVLSNLGKVFPTLCYRREASRRERLAVTICMFPRGEVGAGVLVVSLSYGLSGPAITVAALSLALNLILTGVFIFAVRRLVQFDSGPRQTMPFATAEKGDSSRLPQREREPVGFDLYR